MLPGKVIFTTAALFSLVEFQASARLGENQAQFATRYGTSRENQGKTNSMRTVALNCTKTYEYQGWRLSP